jgi:hypothetical protein
MRWVDWVMSSRKRYVGSIPHRCLPDLHGIERLAGAAFVATGEPLARAVDVQAVASLVDWLGRAAHATVQGSALQSVEEDPTTTESETAAQTAVSKLRFEADHVAKSAP